MMISGAAFYMNPTISEVSLSFVLTDQNLYTIHFWHYAQHNPG